MKKLHNYQKTLLAGAIMMILGSACKFMTLFFNNKLIDIIFAISLLLNCTLMCFSVVLIRKENPNRFNNDLKLIKASKYMRILFAIALITAIVIFVLILWIALKYYF